MSQDLRERVIRAKERKESSEEVAKRFGVGKRSVDRWWKRYVENGERTSRRQGGHRRSSLEGHEGALSRWIEANTSITLRELVERCRKELGVKIKKSGMAQRLKKIGLSYKKNDARRGARATRRQSGPAKVEGRTKRVGRATPGLH